jgi:hypothetical protein
MQVPKWSCAFLPASPTRGLRELRGHYECLAASGRHEATGGWFPRPPFRFALRDEAQDPNLRRGQLVRRRGLRTDRSLYPSAAGGRVVLDYALKRDYQRFLLIPVADDRVVANSSCAFARRNRAGVVAYGELLVVGRANACWANCGRADSVGEASLRG